MTFVVIEPRSDENVPRVMIVPGKVERKMTVVGVKFDAAAGVQTPHDEDWQETREIQGAWLEVANHQPGDFVELFVVMPASPPEIPEEVVVGQFGESVYIPPSGKVEQIVSEGTVSFPPGFKIRLTYSAVSGGETRSVYAWLRMRK